VPSLFRRKPDDVATDVKPTTAAARPATAKVVSKTVTKTAPKPVTKAPATKAATTKTSATKATPAKAPAKTSGPVLRPTKATTLKTAQLTTEADSPTKSRSYTTSKKDLGQATPKRKAGGRTAEPPPANRREAYKRMRAKERESRAEARAGAMAGKDEFLPKRDQGPERALVRDIVDARNSISRYFMGIAFVLVLATSVALPGNLRYWANYVFYLVIVLVGVDCFMMTRTLRKVLPERFPKSALPPRSHYFYAIMRALSFRKLRMPAPRVKVGEKV
jgi:hypothetical protein